VVYIYLVYLSLIKYGLTTVEILIVYTKLSRYGFTFYTVYLVGVDIAGISLVGWISDSFDVHVEAKMF